jgi:hypothetical protein
VIRGLVGELHLQPRERRTEEGGGELQRIDLLAAGDRQPAVDEHEAPHELGTLDGQPGGEVGAERVTDDERGR